jgi:hypothetical protein
MASERDNSLLGPFSETLAIALIKLDVLQLEAHCFRCPATGRVKGFQKCFITKPIAVSFLRGF